MRLSLRLGLGLVPQLYASTSALSLSFSTASVLDSRITFTRASLAMRYDSTGKLTYAPNNILLQSNDFANVAWTKVSLTQSAGVVTATAGLAWRYLLQTPTATNGNTTTSVKLKAGTHSYVQILNDGAGLSADFANFDLVAGTVSTTGVAATISNAGDGYWLCSITGGGDPNFGVYISAVTGLAAVRAESWTAAGTETFLIKDAQLEAVTYETTPRTYNATTASAFHGARLDHNPATLAPLGLLIEEARTNLFTYSQDFGNAAWLTFGAGATKIGVSSEVSPNGTLNAYEVNVGTVGGATPTYQAVSLAAASHTMSVWARAKTTTSVFRLQLHDGTNEIYSGDLTATTTWQRFTFTVTKTGVTAPHNVAVRAGSAGGTVENIHLFGAQLEAGAFATSYIPTVAATVTRAADSASMTGTNFSSWFNAVEGTFVSEASCGGVSVAAFIGHVNDGTSNEYIDVGRYQSTLRSLVTDGNVTQATLVTGGTANGTVRKFAVAYKLNDFAASENGGVVQTDAVGTIPTVNRMFIGFEGSSFYLNGHIKSLTYFKTRKTNLELVGLST